MAGLPPFTVSARMRARSSSSTRQAALIAVAASAGITPTCACARATPASKSSMACAQARASISGSTSALLKASPSRSIFIAALLRRGCMSHGFRLALLCEMAVVWYVHIAHANTAYAQADYDMPYEASSTPEPLWRGTAGRGLNRPAAKKNNVYKVRMRVQKSDSAPAPDAGGRASCLDAAAE